MIYMTMQNLFLKSIGNPEGDARNAALVAFSLSPMGIWAEWMDNMQGLAR